MKRNSWFLKALIMRILQKPSITYLASVGTSLRWVVIFLQPVQIIFETKPHCFVWSQFHLGSFEYKFLNLNYPFSHNHGNGRVTLNERVKNRNLILEVPIFHYHDLWVRKSIFRRIWGEIPIWRSTSLGWSWWFGSFKILPQRSQRKSVERPTPPNLHRFAPRFGVP